MLELKTMVMAACLIAALPACDSPDPAAEDPFQQLAQGPGKKGDGPTGDKAPQGDAGVQPAQPQGPADGGAGDGGNGGAIPTPDPREFVEVAGTLSIEGWDKPVQIDFVETENEGPEGRPRLTLTRLKAPGPFSIQILKGAGSVEVNVYLDAAGDGPGDGDIMLDFPGSPITVGDSAITDLEIKLDKNGPPPPGEEGAPGEGGAVPPPPGEGDGGQAGATGSGDDSAPADAGPPAPGEGEGDKAAAPAEAGDEAANPPPPGEGDGGAAGATGAAPPEEAKAPETEEAP